MKKRNICLSILLVIFIGIIGQIGKNTFIDAGILDAKRIENLENLAFHFDGIFTEDDYYNTKTYKDEYISPLDNADFIAIVKPTGNIILNSFDLRQEVTIQKIQKGNKKLEGTTVYLQVNNGISYDFQEDNKQKAIYNSSFNVMQQDYEYLAFFNHIKLEDYLKDYPMYKIVNPFFGYLQLNTTPFNGTIPNTENPYYLKDLTEYEFFTDSENMLALLYEIKQEILDRYLK